MFKTLLAECISPGVALPPALCYPGPPGLPTLGLLSDGLIMLASFAIALALRYFVRKRTDLHFNWIFVCFAVFIVASGCTHLLAILSIWFPALYLTAGIKAITAATSVVTAGLVVKFMPIAIRLPSPAALQSGISKLESEVESRSRREEGLRSLNATLEARVVERTIQLETLNSQLIDENTRFAMAAEAAGLGVWDLDLQHNRLKWDAWMYTLYGRAQSLGENPEDILADSLHPDDRAASEKAFAETISGTDEFSTQLRIVHPDGTVRYIKSKARLMRDSSGRAIRMFGVDMDITELKRADERFRLAIEAAPTGMMLMNDSGSIVMVNARIESLYGYSREELLGESIELLVPERFRAHDPTFREGYFAAPKSRASGPGRDLYGLRKDGSEFPVEIGLNPLHTSEGEFVLSSVVDLSHRQEIDRLRNDFVSTVSHELRTPLTSISGSLGLLRAGALGRLPEKAAAMIEIAYKNSGRLVRIINDILDIGKLEAGQLTLQMVSVGLVELLRQAIEANSAYAATYGVRFVLGGEFPEVMIMADPDRLMQVLTNLLSNAAKFSRRGTEVFIRVKPAIGAVRVQVEDTGPGIPKEFQNRIFQKFAQADASPARRFEGTGLGLSIARQLVHAMGGTIGFATSVGRGTIFHLELLLSEQAPVARQIPMSEAAAARALFAPIIVGMEPSGPLPRVLHVEDDEDLVRVIEATLAGRAQIVPAHCLKDAERLLYEERFDMVILDQALPDGNGLSLLDRVPGLIQSGVPIVLLVNEAPATVGTNIVAVLVKSQVSAAQAAADILAQLSRTRS